MASWNSCSNDGINLEWSIKNKRVPWYNNPFLSCKAHFIGWSLAKLEIICCYNGNFTYSCFNSSIILKHGKEIPKNKLPSVYYHDKELTTVFSRLGL